MIEIDFDFQWLSLGFPSMKVFAFSINCAHLSKLLADNSVKVPPFRLVYLCTGRNAWDGRAVEGSLGADDLQEWSYSLVGRAPD